MMTQCQVIQFHRPRCEILTEAQAEALREALSGRLLSLCFGAGVDSTAMIVALHEAGIRPDVITFADTGGEKPKTLLHVDKMNRVLASWGWPTVHVCRKQTLPTTNYNDLYGNCMSNETLPSLAFGMKSCSIKWKATPQDQFLKGVKSGPYKAPPHPVWIRSVETGQKIVKLIGYDCGRADLRRSRKPPQQDAEFDFCYPLQIIGWTRPDCVDAIKAAIGPDMVPIKSACFFCPASKIWELYWLAAHHPELFEEALILERNALTGRHSRFPEAEFGASWDEMVKSSDRFPSTSTCVGLGRTFSWNQWALVNHVVDKDFKVRRQDTALFAQRAEELRTSDNALDSRGAAIEDVVANSRSGRNTAYQMALDL